MHKLKTKPDCFRGVNIVTPSVLAYYRAGEYYVELSRGRGMDGQPLYGLTARRAADGAPAYDKSGCFATREAALARLAELDAGGEE